MNETPAKRVKTEKRLPDDETETPKNAGDQVDEESAEPTESRSAGASESDAVESGPMPVDPKKPFSCPICKKNFTTQKIKETHVQVLHENLSRFKCNHCGKALASNAHLKAHQQIHLVRIIFFLWISDNV